MTRVWACKNLGIFSIYVNHGKLEIPNQYLRFTSYPNLNISQTFDLPIYGYVVKITQISRAFKHLAALAIFWASVVFSIFHFLDDSFHFLLGCQEVDAKTAEIKLIEYLDNNKPDLAEDWISSTLESVALKLWRQRNLANRSEIGTF